MTLHAPSILPSVRAATTEIPALRFTGALAGLAAPDRAALLDRSGAAGADPEAVRATVAGIIARVRQDGDRALIEMALAFDGVALAALEVPRERWDESLAALDPALRDALERAATNLATFHRAQLPAALEVETEPGVVLGRRTDALARVGIYAPGGRASYPSSVLMAAIPARVAGVAEVVLCSPPDASGLPSPAVLAAAALAGVDRVFAIGGAGAIAALAFGTESVPRVERIVGPGNAYVAEAKLAVSRVVAIDSPAGPSEILVLADASADPVRVARELLAQAEHDPLACALAVAIGDGVATEIERALADLVAEDAAYVPRYVTLAAALSGQGGVLSAASLDEAVAFANDYAPEHLLLALTGAEAALARIRNAGTVFLGDGGSVAFGDYLTGANHVLPTGGFARAFSGLSTLDFIRTTTWQRIDAGAAARLANAVAVFADAERLPAHAAAARTFAHRTGAGGAAASGIAAPTAGDEGRSPASGPGAPGSPPIERARASADGEFAASTALPRARASASDEPGAEARAAEPRDRNGNASEAGAMDPSGNGAVRGATRLEPRASYRHFSAYSPERAPAAIDLSDNTSAFGAPPSARRVLIDAGRASLTRYPSVYSDALRAALAVYSGAAPDEIVTGCGSDDVLDSALRAFTEPGDRVAYLDPTFTMMPVFSRMNGLEPAPVPFGPGVAAGTAVRDLLATGARVIYLCSPNNPTGTPLPERAIERIVADAPGLVIVDRAYAEFAADPGPNAEQLAGLVPGLAGAGNVLVVRTLSKAFGLAGLRIGYGTGDRALVAEVTKSRGPFKVSSLAERAAVAALTHDLDWVASHVRAVRRNRRRFARALAALGYRPLPSLANFVLVPVRDASAAAAALRVRGIAVRPFAGLTGIGDALRITIGRGRDMRIVLAAMAALEPEFAIRAAQGSA